jgi:2-C-methyl-D-erythritol 2,4-cyclodiphosphate synthase
MLGGKGWLVANIDATIVAEQPRLKGHIDGMRQNIGRTLGISLEQVSIKASTSEQLGFTGREEGIAVWAVAAIMEKYD